MPKRRVVITGLGIVSPVGSTVASAWANIVAGQSGIRSIEDFDVSAFAAQFAGLVSGFDPSAYIPSHELRRSDPFIHYGIAAGVDAVRHAGLEAYSELDKDRVGVCMGSGIGGLDTIEKNSGILHDSGPRRISPFFIPGSIINMISGHLSIRYGYRGPNLAIATACSTGTHSIGLALRCIQYGDADLMIAGGSEYASTPTGLAGFAASRALSTRNEAPTLASRPWDRDRDGFVLGNGAGALVLEEYEHAKRRGAPILAELLGFGMSADAFHITRPAEGGAGAILAMRTALRDAGIKAEQIDYLNAHGTSTPVGDTEELLAVQAVLGPHTQVSMSSTKSMTGHLLGAAGAIEAVFSVLALRDQIAPPTINLFNPDAPCNLDLVPHTAKKRSIQVAVSNSFAFGGTNGTLVFQKI